MDILEALEAAGVEIHPGSNEDEITLCCPFCLEEGETSIDERFRLGINIRTGKANCFNCGKKAGNGDWIFKELERVLETGEITARQDAKKKKKSNGHVTLPEGFLRLYHHNSVDLKDSWFRKAYTYAKSRRITDDQLKDKRIGYTLIGNYHHRIIFPVYVHDKLKGYVGRDFIGDQDPPYKNSSGDKTLYNFPKHRKSTVVLLEGVIDTLVVERSARKLDIDAISILGDKLTDEQVEMLSSYKRIILWFDPDKAGVNASLRAVKIIPKDKIVKIVLPRGFVHEGASDVDPDELEKEVIVKRLLNAEQFTPTLQQKLRNWSAWTE